MDDSRSNDIRLLGELLGIELPAAYAAVLADERAPHLDGSPMLGLPLTADLDSPWGATEAVWRIRPDLDKHIIVLQFRGDRAVCLDLRKPGINDPPIIEIALDGRGPAVVRSRSFTAVVHRQGEAEARIEVENLAAALGLDFPDALTRALSSSPFPELISLMYRIEEPEFRPPSLIWALAILQSGPQPAPDNLIPLMPVDEKSFACVVCRKRDEVSPKDFGRVVRWHIERVPGGRQRELLDLGTDVYLQSAAAELRARGVGLKRMEHLSEAYHESHGREGRLPKTHEERPIRLAVQNVIVGLAALRHDRTYDALAVTAWQTCQVPHVAAHEGCRGLASMTLAEAFRAGGTMEIRFDQHPEREVPASLRQYARTQGVAIGHDDPKSVSPTEARELFLATARMPLQLARRVDRASRDGVLSPERACFVIASGIWRTVELDFLLGTSPRTESILRGGCDPFDRPTRQAEQSASIAALMAGLLHARLSGTARVTGAAAQVVEDERQTIHWEVMEADGGIGFHGVPARKLPWIPESVTSESRSAGAIVVLPRQHCGSLDAMQASRLAMSMDVQVALLLPADAPAPPGQEQLARDGVVVMRCPVGTDELTRLVANKLLSCKVGRT